MKTFIKCKFTNGNKVNTVYVNKFHIATIQHYETLNETSIMMASGEYIYVNTNDEIKALTEEERENFEEVEWKPEVPEIYYTIGTSNDGTQKILKYKWYNNMSDANRYKQNNCFQTREEAEQKLAKIKSVLRGEI